MHLHFILRFFSIDFDLYLKRPGSRGEICLNPERDITEYGIKKDVRQKINGGVGGIYTLIESSKSFVKSRHSFAIIIP